MSSPLTLGTSIDGLLDRLYAQSLAQNDSLGEYFAARAADGSLDWNNFDARTNEFLEDKLIALDRTKAEFCYHVCRALGARRIVEAGTSFGVSTLFLASAVRDNLRHGQPTPGDGPPPVVIGTEFEPTKARRARSHSKKPGCPTLSIFAKAISAQRSPTSKDPSISCSSTSGRRWPDRR